MTKKKGCLGCLRIVVILLVLGGIIGALSGDSTTTSSSKNAKKEKSVPVYTCEVEGVGKIKGAFSSDVGIAVAGISEAGEVGNQFHKVQAQGKYVIVKIVVTNNQKDAVTVDSNLFKLMDDQEREFTVSSDAWTALQMANGNAKGFLSKVNPGITTMVQFPFEVPKNVKGLKLKARGGFTGKEIILQLQVQKAE